MLYHKGTSAQPECPLRIESIHKYLKEHGFLDKMDAIDIFESETSIDSDGQCKYPTLSTLHSEEQIATIAETSENLEDGKIENILLKSLYYCNMTFICAKLAADACLSAVSQILDLESP